MAAGANDNAAANAAMLRGIVGSIGMIPDFPDLDTLAPAPPARAPLAAQFAAACDRWRLGDADRAALLGVPPAALARWCAGGALDDVGTLPPSPADRAAVAVELNAVLRFVPGADPDVAAFLRRSGTGSDRVGAALDAMLARPAGLVAVRAHMVTLGLPRMLQSPPDGPGAWGDLYDDLIVAEVQAIREALLAEAGYDLEAFSRQTRARAAAHEARERGVASHSEDPHAAGP